MKHVTIPLFLVWLDLARTVPGVRGFMYTPWQRKYDLLGEFGDLLRRAP